jgi:hypothetical protein
VLDGTGKHASSILGVRLAVDLECFLEVIGGVVRFIKALSKVYRKTDPEDAARVLSSAIQHYVLRGNLRRAATQQQLNASWRLLAASSGSLRL